MTPFQNGIDFTEHGSLFWGCLEVSLANTLSNFHNYIFILLTCALDPGHDKLTEGQQKQDDGGGDKVHCDVVPGKIDPRRLLHLIKTILILQEVPKPV